ncbi:hypothetical protein FACS18945_6190 [Bacteroidia bacterium]|nr:hypothetical protein FACS18945_6190 [Bacteroidia bacterium]
MLYLCGQKKNKNMGNEIYDLDVALATIGIVKGKKIVEYANETKADRQQSLKQEMMLRCAAPIFSFAIYCKYLSRMPRDLKQQGCVIFVAF